MSPLQTIWFMLVLLPSYILMDGVQKFFRFMNKKKGRWDIFLLVLVGLLALVVIFLLSKGYPVR